MRFALEYVLLSLYEALQLGDEVWGEFADEHLAHRPVRRRYSLREVRRSGRLHVLHGGAHMLVAIL